MGSLKEGLTTKVETGQEIGREISSIGEQKSAEAAASSETLSSLECIDDDDREAAENARNEARSTGENIAFNEIRQPTSEVVSGLNETSNEAQEYASIEHSDASKATGMTGDYSSIGSSLSSSFEQSAITIENIASNATDIAAQIESTNEALAAAIESAF